MVSENIPREISSLIWMGVDRRRYLVYKHALDLILCVVALPFLLLLMAVIAVLIMLETPGSPIFIQERVGRGGRLFRMYKFRTMNKDHDDRSDREFQQAYVAGKIALAGASHCGPAFKPGSKQLTRLGALLRKTSLDELPQVFNVLQGEMSLIGPRPNVPWEVEKYQSWHYKRLEVLPGLTGLAQVRGRSNITFNELVRYDIDYVHNVSLKMDIGILLQTFRVVATSRGAG